MKICTASRRINHAMGEVSAGICRLGGYNAGLCNSRFLAGQTDKKVSPGLDRFHNGHQITSRTSGA